MNWTHAICQECYRFREPFREPVTIREKQAETCCDCGHETWDGIYYRADPRTVRFPAPEEER